MKSVIQFSFSLWLLVTLSACVSYPNTEAFDLPTGAKIGYEIELSEQIGHTHYGTTVFNNISKVNETQNWALNLYAKTEAKRLIEEHGFIAVEVNQADSDEARNIVEKSEGRSLSESDIDKIRSLENAKLEKLKADYNVDAMITLTSHENVVAMECGSYGCTEFRAKYPGFYSRGLVLLPPFLHAVLPSINSAYLVDPYKPIHKFIGPYGKLNPQLLIMKGFKPEKFKSMTDKEWSAVEAKLKELITNVIANNVKALKAGADGQGGFIRSVN